MISEVTSLIRNKTWRLVERPTNRKVIGSRFVLRNKYNSAGEVDKRKARVVARGFTQKPGVDFHDTFAPVARLSSIRTAVAVAVQRNMKIEQVDITTAYLNGTVEEEIFMEPPDHIEEILELIVSTKRGENDIKKEAEEMLKVMRNSDVVCHLQKALYGLRQAGRAWHSRLDKELRAYGAVPSNADPCVYCYGPDDSKSFVIVYVDDMILMSQSEAEINKMRKYLGLKLRSLDH